MLRIKLLCGGGRCPMRGASLEVLKYRLFCDINLGGDRKHGITTPNPGHSPQLVRSLDPLLYLALDPRTRMGASLPTGTDLSVFPAAADRAHRHCGQQRLPG